MMMICPFSPPHNQQQPRIQLYVCVSLHVLVPFISFSCVSYMPQPFVFFPSNVGQYMLLSPFLPRKVQDNLSKT